MVLPSTHRRSPAGPLALVALAAFLLRPRLAFAQTGACCSGTSCTLRTVSACDSVGGEFLGGSCTGNPTTCCPANFNAVGGVTIADIFAFLTAWFSGC